MLSGAQWGKPFEEKKIEQSARPLVKYLILFGSTLYSFLHGVPMLTCNTVYLAARYVTKYVINSVAERDYSAQETWHLLLQLLLINPSCEILLFSVLMDLVRLTEMININSVPVTNNFFNVLCYS